MALFNKKNDSAGKANPEKENSGKAKTAKTGEEKPKKSMKDLYGDGGSKKAEAKTEKSKAASGKKEQRAYRILVRPIVTEKASILAAVNKYVFEVSYKANKIEIAKSIEEVYGVKPVKVNIMRFEGKKVRYGKTRGKRSDWKKALVTLPAGKSITVYEGV